MPSAYPRAVRIRALELYATDGATEAARTLGVSRRAVGYWARAAGLVPEGRRRQTAAAAAGTSNWAFIRRYDRQMATLEAIDRVQSPKETLRLIESFWGRMQVELLTGNGGAPASNWPTPSSNTSRSSTTGNDATPAWGCEPRSNTRESTTPTHPSHSRVKQADSTELGEHQSLHQSRGGSIRRWRPMWNSIGSYRQ
jgi:transposase-like protein